MQGNTTFIIITDGIEYGPTDLSTLASWASSGKIKPQSIVTEVQTGNRFAAAEHPFLRTRLPEVVAPPTFQIASPSPAYKANESAESEKSPPKLTLIWVMWGVTILHYAIGATANGNPGLVFGAFALLGLPSTGIAIILAASNNKTDRTNGIVKLVTMVFALFALIIVIAAGPPPINTNSG